MRLPVLWNRDGFASWAARRSSTSRCCSRVELLAEDPRQRLHPGDLGPRRQHLDGLGLDRVGVGQVGDELLADAVRILLAQRGIDRAVEACGEALAHRPFLSGDPLGHLDHRLIAGLARCARQQIVGRQLHVLV